MPADPLLAALTRALAPYGPISVAAIRDAADMARTVLGTDRCIHDRVIHAQHHTSPVDRCPWCMTSSPADRAPAPPAVTTINPGSIL